MYRTYHKLKAMTKISIRNATRADINRIAEFQQAMALETEGRTLDPSTSRQGIIAIFDDPRKGFYIVAEAHSEDDNADEVVGSLLITYEWSDWSNATHWWIQSVYVDAAWRRRGVYRTMYEHVWAWSRGAAIYAASASTWNARTPSPSRHTRA